MRSVLVTGASSGIGRATALHLDTAGWRVFAGVRREEDAAALLRAGSPRLVPLLLDITSAEQISAASERIAATVGTAGLDGLVNNAGITIPCPLEALSLEDFNRLLAINVSGQLAVTQALLSQLRTARGRIVFISSLSARRAMPILAAYSASKAGLNAIADGFRQELRPWGIGVSIVEPGAVETPIWDRGTQELESAIERDETGMEELYGGLIAASNDLADRFRKKRVPPQRVVAAIERALTARRARPRYLVGLDAKSQAFVMRLLPDRIIDLGVARLLRA